MILFMRCPTCRKPHGDEGEWATRSHHTHRCVNDSWGTGCGLEWEMGPGIFGASVEDLTRTLRFLTVRMYRLLNGEKATRGLFDHVFRALVLDLTHLSAGDQEFAILVADRFFPSSERTPPFSGHIQFVMRPVIDAMIKPYSPKLDILSQEEFDWRYGKDQHSGFGVDDLSPMVREWVLESVWA